LSAADNPAQNWGGRNNAEAEDEPMATSELYEKGAAMRRQLMGDAAIGSVERPTAIRL